MILTKVMVMRSLFALCSLLIVVMQFHNARTMPVSRGFDSRAHIEYFDYLKEKKQIPLANEGWELYQPPFYYIIGAILPSYKTTQWFGFALWIVFSALLAYWLKDPADEWKTWLTVLCILLIPVNWYVSLSIGNEFLSGFLISLIILFYDTQFLKSPQSVRRGIILGILLAASLLTKATGLIILGTILIERGTALKADVVKVFHQLSIPLSVTIMLSGWFYLRNAMYFGNPLIASADFIPLAYFDQPFIPRTLHFIFNLWPLFSGRLFYTSESSLVVGTYLSWFYDGHAVMLPVTEFSKAGTVFVALTLVSFVTSVVGFVLILMRRTRTDVLLALYTLLLWVSYLLYNLKLPFYSTVKGSFLISLVPVYVYTVVVVLDRWPAMRYVLSVVYVLLTLVAFKHFWTLGWWYPNIAV